MNIRTYKKDGETVSDFITVRSIKLDGNDVNNFISNLIDFVNSLEKKSGIRQKKI